MADKEDSDLVLVSNKSETDSNPRKRQGTLVIFFKMNKVLHNFKWVFVHHEQLTLGETHRGNM